MPSQVGQVNSTTPRSISSYMVEKVAKNLLMFVQLGSGQTMASLQRLSKILFLSCRGHHVEVFSVGITMLQPSQS
jgi:hypothetical protein